MLMARFGSSLQRVIIISLIHCEEGIMRRDEVAEEMNVNISLAFLLFLVEREKKKKKLKFQS